MRILAAAVLLGLSANAMAGVVMQMQERDLGEPQAKPDSRVFYFQDGAFRTESPGASEVSVYRDEAMYMIDTKSRSYRKIDKAQAQQLGDQLAGMRKKMEEHMANMSPEQRAMIENAIGRTGAGASAAAKPDTPVFTVRDTGRSESAAGYSCRVWEVLSNAKKEHEVCAAAPAAFPGGNDMLKSMRDIGNFVSGLTRSIGGKASAVTGYWTQIQQINGVPLITRDFDASGKPDSELRVIAVKEENLAAALFQVPAGYTQKKMPNLGALAGGNDDDDKN
jgi:hypothetical protein